MPKNILHLICSPKGHASQSAGVSRYIVEHLVACDPGSEVVVRCLNARTMPHIDRAFSQASREAGDADIRQGTFNLSDELIGELEQSDAIVLATPMHNLSIPSVLKAWVDHVVRPHRTFRYAGAKMIGLLRDRPVFAVLSAGGSFSDGEQPEFVRAYLRAVFAAIGITSIEFFALDQMPAVKRSGVLPAAEALSILANSTVAETRKTTDALSPAFGNNVALASITRS